MAVNPCNVLDALADFQLDLMRRLNKKFEQLRRLAQLLQQLGDLSALAPNLNALIPVINIDFDLYNQLAANCPFLGLPSPPLEGDLNALRSQVLAAYNGYVAKILNHPYSRLGQVQEQLTAFQRKISGAMGMGTDYIRCLQTLCATASALNSTIDKLQQADIDKTVSDFTKNYVENAGKVLTEPMEISAKQSKEALAQAKSLGADFQKDYKELKATSLQTFTERPTATTAGSVEWKNPPYAPMPTTTA